jgi:hypothetical protein
MLRSCPFLRAATTAFADTVAHSHGALSPEVVFVGHVRSAA